MLKEIFTTVCSIKETNGSRNRKTAFTKKDGTLRCDDIADSGKTDGGAVSTILELVIPGLGGYSGADDTRRAVNANDKKIEKELNALIFTFRFMFENIHLGNTFTWGDYFRHIDEDLFDGDNEVPLEYDDHLPADEKITEWERAVLIELIRRKTYKGKKPLYRICYEDAFYLMQWCFGV